MTHRFDGHKAAIAVNVKPQRITAAQVLPGNSHDQSVALDLVDATEKNTGTSVELTIGDCAYGSRAEHRIRFIPSLGSTKTHPRVLSHSMRNRKNWFVNLNLPHRAPHDCSSGLR